MEYNVVDAIRDLVTQLRLTNEKLESLEVKFFHFEAKLCDIDDKVSKVLDITDGVSTSFGNMNVTPDQVQTMLKSFGLTGNSGGTELVESLQTFRSKLNAISAKLSEISVESDKI